MIQLVSPGILPYIVFAASPIFFATPRVLALAPSPLTITAAPHPTKDTRAPSIDTCGFVSGDLGSPITCEEGYTCSFDGPYNNIMACCNSVICTSDPQTCIPHLATVCADMLLCSQIYSSFTLCSADSPACVTYHRIASAGDELGLTSYSCGPTPTQIIALVTPTTQGTATATTGEVPKAVISTSPGPTTSNSLLETARSSGAVPALGQGNTSLVEQSTASASSSTNILKQSNYSIIWGSATALFTTVGLILTYRSLRQKPPGKHKSFPPEGYEL